jgi:hypothetical protein
MNKSTRKIANRIGLIGLAVNVLSLGSFFVLPAIIGLSGLSVPSVAGVVGYVATQKAFAQRQPTEPPLTFRQGAQIGANAGGMATLPLVFLVIAIFLGLGVFSDRPVATFMQENLGMILMIDFYVFFISGVSMALGAIVGGITANQLRGQTHR